MATLNTDYYTQPLLNDLEGAGAGERKRIDDAAQATLGSLIGRLFSTGMGTSSLIGSYTLGNEDRHQQALLDLSDKLIGQRLSARQAGAGLALNQYGIDTQSETSRYGIDKQAATTAATTAASLAEQRYEADNNYRLGLSQANSMNFRNSRLGNAPIMPAKPPVPPFTLGMPTSLSAISSWNQGISRV